MGSETVALTGAASAEIADLLIDDVNRLPQCHVTR
jgi:hypothetical protein